MNNRNNFGNRKIILATNSFGFGGKEKLICDLAIEFKRKLIDCDIVVFSKSVERSSDMPGFNVHCLAPRFKADLKPVFDLRKLLRAEKTVNLICFDFFSYFHAKAAALLTLKEVNLIISLHSCDFMENKNAVLQAKVFKRILSTAEKLVGSCFYQAEFYDKQFSLPKERFLNIYNGIDTNYFRRGSEPVERLIEQNNLIKGKRYILQVAGLRPEKRHKIAIKAMRHFQQATGNKDVILLFLGNGSENYIKELNSLAEKEGVQDNILILGKRPDTRPYYEIAELFTLSSSIETFSIACLEAMSYGLPCVVTKVGGSSEMITEGVHGFLVPPDNPEALANGWKKVLDNPSSFDRQKIRAYAESRFSINTCANNYEKLLIV